MESILNSSVTLDIYEPWEKTETLHGVVVETHLISNDSYLIIKVKDKKGLFKVSERYVAHTLMQLNENQKVHVNIGYSSDDAENDFKHYGIGSVRLASP